MFALIDKVHGASSIKQQKVSMTRWLPDAPRGAIKSLIVLLLLLMSTGAAGSDGPRVATGKDVYEPNEPITIRFQNSPGHPRDYVAIAKHGMPDRGYIRSQYLRDAGTSGTKEMRGLKKGSYEARLYRARSREVLARYPFTVGQNCLEAPAAGEPQSCDMSVWTAKNEYAVDEPVEVFFEGAPGNNLDRIAITKKMSDGKFGTPDEWQKKRRKRLRKALKGSHIFPGLEEGEYQLELHIARTNRQLHADKPPAAVHPFSVVQAPATTSKDIAAQESRKEPLSGERPQGRKQTAAKAEAAGSDGPAAKAEAAGSDGPRVTTAKDVYEPNEPITIRYQNAPGDSYDFVAIAKHGMPDHGHIRSQFLRDAGTSGTKELRGLKKGSYEARLYRARSSEVLARYPFTVGQNCLEAPAAGEPQSCDMSVWTAKNEYAVDEPVEVFFEGAPGNSYDWITITKKMSDGKFGAPADWRGKFGQYGPPDNEWKPWNQLHGALKGSHIFPGLEEGEYQLELHVVRTNRQLGADKPPAAVHTFSVAQAPATAAKGFVAEHRSPTREPVPVSMLPEPGIDGSWLGYVSCTLGRTHSGELKKTYLAILELTGSQKVDADLSVLWPNGLALRLAGTFDSADGRMSLQPTEWIFTPRGNAPALELHATLEQSGRRLVGELRGADKCSKFEAYKYRRDDRKPNPDGLIPIYQKYEKAAINQQNCERLMKWAIDGESIATQGEEIPSQIADYNAFHAFMGKTYDEWTYKHTRDFQRFWQQCISLLGRSNKVASRSLRDRALKSRQAGTFLSHGRRVDVNSPAYDARNRRNHFGYQSKYALVISLRYARLYADLQLQEARNLADSRNNLDKLLADIAYVKEQKGLFKALPASDSQQQIASLRQLKVSMSGRLVDQEFEKFDLASYSNDLKGLKQAWDERRSVVKDASTYATESQVAALRDRFTSAFAPLSKSVAGQTIAAMPRINGSAEGFIEGKKQKDEIKRAVVPVLNSPDKKRVLAAYEQRNVTAVKEFLPTFSDWLKTHISPDRAGKRKLEQLTRDMFGQQLAELEQKTFNTPYYGIAEAILVRQEGLKYEICELPRGFEELRSILCPEATAIADLGGGGR